MEHILRTGPIVKTFEWSHRNQLQLLAPRINILPKVLKQQGDTCSYHSVLNCLETRVRKFLAQQGTTFDNSLSIRHAIDVGGEKRYPPKDIIEWLMTNGVADTRNYFSLIDLNLDKTIPQWGIEDGCHEFLDPPNNVEEMKKEIQEVGPIIIGFPMCMDFSASEHGIYFGKGEKDFFENDTSYHAVLATGYGWTTDGTFYWEYMNSAGRNFGDHGFGKVVSTIINMAISIRKIRVITPS